MRDGQFFHRFLFLLAFWAAFFFYGFPAAECADSSQVSQKSQDGYNVVLIFIDTLRADHLSCYGYPKKTSPNIDRLAKESVVFKQNFSPVSYTLPGFISIITSLYPSSHGVLEVYKDKLSDKVKTLAAILQMHGYKTAWFGPNPELQLSPEEGFGRGFDEVDTSFERNLKKEKKILCDWLGKNKDKKFFLNFHTYKAHHPYFPLLKYREKFTREKIEGVLATPWDIRKKMFSEMKRALQEKKGPVWESLSGDFASELIAQGFFEGDFGVEKVKDARDYFLRRQQGHRWFRITDDVYFSGMNLKDIKVNRYVQALYDASILEYDQEVIGPLVEDLKSLGLYDKTIIVICSDHGEEFYEHKGFGHGATLYREVTHVPLIMRVPWMKQGKLVNELTSNVDILPTLLDLAGVPPPHEAQGKSLATFFYNNKSLPPHDYVFGWRFGLSSMRSKKWHYLLRENGQEELYDLVADPKEQKDVHGGHQDIAQELKKQMKQWEASLPSYREERKYPPEIDKVMQERIRKTGYW